MAINLKESMSKEEVIKPTYYKGESTMDVIEVARMFQMSFTLGNVLKYIVRAGLKGKNKEIEDLEKAREYLDREIEHLKSAQTTNN